MKLQTRKKDDGDNDNNNLYADNNIRDNKYKIGDSDDNA